MKNGETKNGEGRSGLVERIRWLLQAYWESSQSKMARELDCSQATISKVLSGDARPGARLISLICRHAAVSEEWLRSGSGKPPSERRLTSVTTASTLPITRVLLPGPPDAYPDKLEGEEFPIAATMYRPTRCWLDLQHDAAILVADDPRLVLQPHDLLLLDYAIAEHQERLTSTDEIVAAWVTRDTGKEPSRRLAIGVLKHYSTDDENPMWLETGRPIYRSLRNTKHVQANLSARDPVTGRTVKLGVRTVPALVTPEGRVEAISEHQFDSESFPIQPDDIVAVCIGIFRRL